MVFFMSILLFVMHTCLSVCLSMHISCFYFIESQWIPTIFIAYACRNMTPPELEPTIYCNWGEYANHDTTDTVYVKQIRKQKNFYIYYIKLLNTSSTNVLHTNDLISKNWAIIVGQRGVMVFNATFNNIPDLFSYCNMQHIKYNFT